MPIPISPFPVAEPLLFPPPKQSDIDAARTSRWYETFEDLTVPTTIIDLGELGERELFLEVRGVTDTTYTRMYLSAEMSS